ncbi:hypothetical protein [Xanthobacter variabilis]|uniref:hypothetical protein n=1 Tax=Xanthobacter variabilis TaxID=3119932 RepID=UPI0037278983
MPKAKELAKAWEKRVEAMLASEMSAEEMAAPGTSDGKAFMKHIAGVASMLSRASANLKRDDGGHGAALADLLRSDVPLTPAMRNALADLVSGKLARGRGQRRANYPLLGEAAELVAAEMAAGASWEEATELAFEMYGKQISEKLNDKMGDKMGRPLKMKSDVLASLLANYLKRGAKVKG